VVVTLPESPTDMAGEMILPPAELEVTGSQVPFDTQGDVTDLKSRECNSLRVFLAGTVATPRIRREPITKPTN
jgi:hypothetical protein